MLALGELTPACLEFHKKLQQERDSQRNESWWIHAVVEYGAGSNFVIDELLKTRAGENVLALMTATASILEGNFQELLSSLFEKIHVPMHSTPSSGQLAAMQMAALPLA
jgi:hypothetical protein